MKSLLAWARKLRHGPRADGQLETIAVESSANLKNWSGIPANQMTSAAEREIKRQFNQRMDEVIAKSGGPSNVKELLAARGPMLPAGVVHRRYINLKDGRQIGPIDICRNGATLSVEGGLSSMRSRGGSRKSLAAPKVHRKRRSR